MTFDAQFQAVRKVQRISGSPEVCFYARSGWENVPLFKRTGEFPLAVLRFSVRLNPYRATLYCVRGHIFALVIVPNRAQIGFAMWESEPEVEVLNDPMNETETAASSTEVAESWRSFLKEHGSQASIAGWELYDENSAYHVALRGGEFLVLAERRGNQFILQGIEEDSGSRGKLLYVPAHESAPELIQQPLEEIVLR